MRLSLLERDVDCRAVIFDKDGTLVDLLGVELSLAGARRAALAALAGAQVAAAWEKAVGVDVARGWVDGHGPLCLAPRRDEIMVAAATLYAHGHPWDEARALALAAYDRADEALEPPYGSELLPGIAEMLAALHDHGLALAIATTDRGWRAKAMLSSLGVAHYFQAYIGADNVTQGKPAPEMVFRICERLGCRPDQAIVVGDSPTDMEMGRAAGAAAVVAVTTGLNSAARLQALADVVLPSAAALPGLLGLQP